MSRRNRLVVASALVWTVVSGGCGGDGDPTDVDEPTPVISTFEPVAGPVGTVVTITGEHFSSTASENTVAFGAAAATPTSASATQLTVAVPDGATTGAISVTVSGRTGTSDSDFTVVSEVPMPRTGLVVFYPFSGSAADSSGNGHDAVNNGAAGFTDRHGTPDRAFSLRPPDHLDVGDVAALQNLGSALTVSAWVRPSSTGINASGTLVSNFNPSVSGFHVTYGAGSRVTFEIAGVGEVSATGLLTAQQWSNVTVTYDGAELRLYHDGELAASAAASGDVTPPGWSLQLGKQRWSNSAPTANYYDGELDDVAIYDRVLTESEVADLYLQTDTR